MLLSNFSIIDCRILFNTPIEVNKEFTVAVRYPNSAADTWSLVTDAECSGAWEGKLDGGKRVPTV